jgi:hypothetical protein
MSEKPKRKPGRPTKYRAEYATEVYKLCLLGATDEDIAGFFEVTVSTVFKWLGEHKAFSEARKNGKERADANVANRLYQRALGWEHDAVKIVADAKTGAEHVVPYVERYPPDTTACIFWLKNRRPADWRDRQNIEHSGEIKGTGVLMLPSTDEDLELWEQMARRQQAVSGGGKNGGPAGHANGNGKR